MSNDLDMTRELLRGSDPVPHEVPIGTAGDHIARATLARILAVPSNQTGSGWRPRRGRVALAGGMLAAATAGLVVLPSLSGSDQAFATWTPAPRGMSAQERADAAAGCRQSQKEGPGAEYADELSSAEPAIAERRGVWATVVLVGSDGFSAMCITDDSSHPFAKDMIGSLGAPADNAAPGPRALAATDLGVGTMNAGDVSLAAGVAGSDVVAVVYRSRIRGNVSATVSQGRFALWLPGNELKYASSNGVDVEATYRDGRKGTSRLTF